MPAKTMEEIAEIMRKVRFKRKLLGGADEDDVWRVMDKLHQEYISVMDAQEQQYNALLNEREQYIAWLEHAADAGGGAAAKEQTP